MNDDPCGAGLDWRNGVEGLRRSLARSTGGTDTVLAGIIERDIIPRLLLAHDAARDVAHARAEAPREMLDIRDGLAWARFVLASNPEQILDQIQGLLDSGIRLQRIYLDLLAPVARKLGELWEQDRCTFVEVTIGLSRLQQVLHEVARRNAMPRMRAAPPRIYLVPVPGEQHTFGLSVVEELFLHAGWETACDHSATVAGILDTVSRKAIDVIGVTVGSDVYLEPLTRLLAQVRKVALNRDMAVLVGGKYLQDHPHLVAQLPGATLVLDGLTAVSTAEELVSRSSRAIAHQTGT